MSIISDVWGDVQRAFGSKKVAKAEDELRSLAPDERRGYRLPVIYADNDMFLTPDSAWIGFAVPSKPWGFLAEDMRKQYFRASTTFFDRIFPTGKDTAGHLLVTNRVYSADEWEEALLDRYPNAGVNFGRYVRGSREAIEQGEFFERECYLFAKMGLRGENGGLRGYLRDAIEFIALGSGLEDTQPDDAERDFWIEQASTVNDQLSASWLGALQIHRRRLEWLTRHLDTPGLPTPDLAPAHSQQWGAGDWRTVLASYTQEVDLGVVDKERLRCVRFESPTGAGTSYAAFLPLNNIPEPLAYNANWIHHASSLKFPVDVSLHFEVIDPDRAEKDLERHVFAAEAQEEEDRDAGVRPDDITAAQHQGLRQVKQNVRMQREPLTYWQAVFCVYDTDKGELLSKVARLKKHYKDLQFKLECPRNDQRELFYQAFPGSDILVQDWMHRTNVQYLAAAMPWLTSTVGDREDAQGTYQGYTIVRDANGNAQRGVPVFHDLHNVVDSEGKAPTEVVSGNPGSGKSVSRGLKIAHEDGLRGITQFIWDPKGDFLPLKLFASRLLLDPAKVKLVDLYKSGNSVSLDAYAIAEVNVEQGIDQRAENALDVLKQLCRDFVNDPQYRLDYTDMLGEAVRRTMVAERTDGKTPTMRATMELLRAWAEGGEIGIDLPAAKREDWKDHARRLVQHLDRIGTSPLGRLLFRDPSTAGAMTITEGDMVIFVALNMVTTEPGQEPTSASLVADVISGLMTDYIRSLLYILPDEVAKSAVFDEWHVIKRTSRAEALLDWLRRMGRSKRCSVRQMSQSAKDFSRGSLSTVWCGWCQDDEEAEAACTLLGIEPSVSNKSLLKNQGKGQFLHRDVFGRVAQVQVDIWDDTLLRMFNTEATAKAETLRALAETNQVTALDPDRAAAA